MAGRERSATAERRLAALFPESGAPGTISQRPWYRHLGVLTSGAVIVVVVTALVASQAFGGSGASYRTATAATENVDAVQTGVATIEPVAQASVAFPVSGTVATVNVHVGDHVDASGTLASLDTTALARTLHAKQAALAQAQLTLSKGLAGQSISLGSGGGSAGGSSGGSGGSGAGAGISGAASASTAAFRTAAAPRIVLAAATPDPRLAAAQQAVLTAQQRVDAALATAATALTAETQACAPLTTTTTPTSTTTPTTPDVGACQQAIAAVSTAQAAVSDAQHALASASSDLDTLLANLSATIGSPGSGSGSGSGSGGAGAGGGGGGTRNGTGGGTGSSGATAGSGGSGGAGSGSGGGGTRSGTGGGISSAGPSAADLVAAQRDVDAAAMAVLAAQQSVDEATISSPLAGTVVAVNMKAGDTVSAGSSTEDIVVEGSGGYEVSTLVGVDQIPSVAVGQDATVLPDGRHTPLTGKVVAISVMPASTATTTTTYRVMIGLTRPQSGLQDGATGTVAIVTKDARAALAVPTSAIVTVRNRHFVNVVHGDAETLTPVQVGVVGATWTEIRSGIGRGTNVALADTSAPLPSSATSSANGQTSTPFGGAGRIFGGAGGTGGLGGFTRGGRGG